MSTPLGSIFEGDITLEIGSDVTQFGWGDLSTARNVIVHGTENSTGVISQGSLLVAGGGRIAKNLHVMQDLHVRNGVTYLAETHIDTSNGPTTITGGNALSVSVGAASQIVSTGGNLTLQSTTQRLQLYGGLNGGNAVDIVALHTNGNVRTLSGLSGSISLLAGTGGLVGTTNTGGSISLTSQGAGSTYSVSSNAGNQNLLIQLQGETDSSVVIESAGTNVTNNALQLRTTSSAGNIAITQPATSSGQVQVHTAMGGFSLTTQTSGPISVTAHGATSLYTNATTADNQHLTISVTGNTNSKVILSSTGTAPDAILLQTTNGTGGVMVDSVGAIQLQTTDTIQGVRIGTNTPVPITIGANNSVTTILGDLYIRGNTSSVDQQVVTIDDNIIVVNNAPYGTSDGGVAVKRYQPVNNAGTGDVVIDTPDTTGTVLSGSNTTTTIHLANSSSNTNNYYNGWWVRILTGTGAGQVRKIKSYNGTSKVATIYSTADQTGALGNPQPPEGLDFVTVPDTTSTYGLYPCHYVMNIWDESANEFALVCSATNPSDPDNPSFEPSIAHYSNLHIQDLVSNAIFTNIINGIAADTGTSAVLTDNTSTPVSVTFPTNYGCYLVFVKPTTNTVRASAIFVMGRIDVVSTPGVVNRLLSIKGAQNEQLFFQWPANSMPELYYRPHPNNLSTTTFTIKIVSL